MQERRIEKDAFFDHVGKVAYPSINVSLASLMPHAIIKELGA